MNNVRNGEPLPAHSTGVSFQTQEQVNLLFQQIVQFDNDRAQSTLSSLTIGLPPRLSLEQVYQPLLARLGSEWAAGRIGIAQEHFASAFLRLHLSPLLAAPNIGFTPRRKALFTTLENEYHEGGLMIMAIQLKIRGWSVYYLGPNLPVSELVSATKAIQPEIVCLACANVSTFERELALLETVPALICAGGYAVKKLQAPLPKNVFTLDLPAYDGAELIDCISSEYASQFQSG